MPRRPRNEVAAGIYHVTARGNRRQPLFLADSDALRFLGGLADAVRRHRWLCYAFCLLPNHFHVLLETREPNLGAGMRAVNGDYAQWFNRRYGLAGHLFQGRFHSAAVETDRHLVELTRYVALNPVRAGLARSPASWRWSSYRLTVSAGATPRFLAADRLLALFASDPVTARREYAAFVAATPAQDRARRDGLAAY